MKKSYCILFGIIIYSAFGYAQELKYDVSRLDLKLSELKEADKFVKRPSIHKAGGDTILYEDFDSTGTGGLPAGWVVENPLNNGNDWIWSDLPPGGMFSIGAGRINSTTGSNGYLLLPADLYNTPLPSQAIAMNTSVISPKINLNPTVNSYFLKFEHALRYCCSNSNELVLEVSSDSLNWTTIDARGPKGNKRSPSTAVVPGNPETLEFMVSSTLANQTTAWFRFRSTGNSHYYWMIDDVLLYEGFDNNMQLASFDISFHTEYILAPLYTKMNVANMPATSYSLRTYNAGANTSTNVTANIDIYMDSTSNGSPGVGLIYSSSSQVNGGNAIAMDECDTAEVQGPPFIYTPGYYKNVFTVRDDSVNQAPQKARDQYLLELNLDTVVALERGADYFDSDFGPALFANGGSNGDILANMLIVDSSTSFTATSISVNISNRAIVDDAQIAARIFDFDVSSSIINSGTTFEPDSGIGNLIGSSSVVLTIDTAIHPDQWVTLPLSAPVVMRPGAYFFGVEQVGNGPNNTAEMWFNRDTEIEKFSHFWQTIVYFASPSTGTPGWSSTISRLPAIRLNGSFTVGVEEVKSIEGNIKFEVFPNPSDGQFRMKLTASQQANYILKITNVVGQTVHTEPISVNGTLNKQMDLSSYNKGIYFISLEDGKDRIVKKVIVK